eukprot:COSAG02_NODE_1269_length_13533_cov_7.935016_15_plen_133_part_00
MRPRSWALRVYLLVVACVVLAARARVLRVRVERDRSRAPTWLLAVTHDSWINYRQRPMYFKHLTAALLWLLLLSVVAALDDGSKPRPWDPYAVHFSALHVLAPTNEITAVSQSPVSPRCTYVRERLAFHLTP